ncbi:hypothetical protein M422DRAFT_234044 [Sphaerobolus stellatus SS14]|uniref:Uncharacterized protein n=1 Tax=Sphaerobolus stellatus (strain SS14) TaxID=990650 RepID=A0A0C9TQS5_SPHS4|nr:hypothetical protein M422DRAFT_234044 [Sphaerobolus stellatus SS14]
MSVVFTLPHSFTNLRTIILDNVCLDDFDITKIHHLPALSAIHLNSTRIGDEAIHHLISLKYQLEELFIDNNARITDHCVPSLCLMFNLKVLHFYGTNISMPGLRKLCKSIKDSNRSVLLDVPSECNQYLTHLHEQYQLYPVAPLIIDPAAVSSLSVNALKANLAGHAQFNPSIYLSGSRPELVNRLRGILARREGDLVVKEVLKEVRSRSEESTEGSDSEEDSEEFGGSDI